MSALKGDFISFSFNGVHSSELGIIRTSDGSRFNENLLPTIQDKTVQVPGGDGTYFFGSYYTQRQFNVPIAFDSLTEEQVRRLYSHFGDKQIHELVFDERPYKYYMAKITGTPQIKTICFDSNEGRIYKGEGTLNFVCYYPFAKSRFKYLDEFDKLSIIINENGFEEKYSFFEFYNNLEEWEITSRMKNSSKNIYDKILDQSCSTTVFNAGDFEADFKIYFNFNIQGELKITNINNEVLGRLKFNIIEKQNSKDKYICFNSKTELLEGIDEFFVPTGSVYNRNIISGNFFKIPVSDKNFIISGPDLIQKIEYDYIYY